MRNADLEECDPVTVEDTFAHEFFDFLGEGIVHGCALRSDLGYEPTALLLINAFLEEDLSRLCKDDVHEELDDIAAEVCGGCVEEVLVDIVEHACARSEVVERALEALGV